MNLTQEQIVKLIADAFRVGRAEGMEIGHKDGYENGLRDGDAEGYDRGWSDGWDEGYAKAEEDAADNAVEEEVTAECRCSACTDPESYDMGWNDGYTGTEIDPDLKDNEAYMDGFLQGRDDREEEPDAA